MNNWKRKLLTSSMVLTLTIPMSVHALETSNHTPRTEQQVIKDRSEQSLKSIQSNQLNTEQKKILQELYENRAKGKLTQAQFNQQLMQWLKSHTPKDRK